METCVGEIQIDISEKPLSTDQGLAAIASLSQGAQILFAGAVREWNHGRKVLAVGYDAYPPLALSELRKICLEAQERWGNSLNFWVSHRTGKLAVGELSVVIAVGSPHRDEAYQASRYVIEELKVRVPIWKKEFYEDGETEWLKGHALCTHLASQSAEARNT